MKKNLDNLFQKLYCCQRCVSLKNKNGKDCSLINFYDEKKGYKKIPSIWTDWERRVDSNIMIIGQDWGPYQDMLKLKQEYEKSQSLETWNSLIESESSFTKKMLTKYLKLSAELENYVLKDNFLDDIYITNSIMCARKGDQYRGNNISLKVSTRNCSPYLKEQIEIVRPKIVVTLGYYPLYSLSLLYNFSIESTLTATLGSKKEIQVGEFLIVPLYHPTAQVTKKIQLEQYRRIWKYMKGNGYEFKK